MSYTTAMGLNVGATENCAVQLAVFQNAWGSAPAVWTSICERYLGTTNWMSEAVTKKLWPLWKDQSIPEHHRTVLAMTYDRVYIEKEHYGRMAADLRKFLEDFPADGLRVNHLNAIAELFESAPDHPQIGFHMNSISNDHFDPQWDEDSDTELPPDWSKCWSLYAHIDEMAAEKVES